MEILKLCRHNILNLRPLYPPASLSSMPELPFPGEFVQLQYVVTLYDDRNKELVDCRMTPIGNCQFEVNNGQTKDLMYVIEVEVHPPAGLSYLVQTSSVDCAGNVLPSHAGKFTLLLPSDTPGTFHISFKFKSVKKFLINHFDENLIDEINTSVITYYAPKRLSDFIDGHSLPAINLPIPRQSIVGILGTPEGQACLEYFQTLVENGAQHCFKRDQERLLLHESSSDPHINELVLAIYLEGSVLYYQMGNLEKCKKYGEYVCREACKFSSPNYNFLVGKAKSILSGAYKQQGDFVKAEELLESSTEMLESVVPGEETAVNRTCWAAMLSEKASVLGINIAEKNKLKKTMKDALFHYGHQLDQNLNKNARSPRRSMIRFIFSCVRSSRNKAPDLQTPVLEDDLKEADHYIQHFMREFLEDCPMRDNILFCCAVGDVLTMKGEYEEGISAVSEALAAAEELQLREDLIGIRHRLQQLHVLRQMAGDRGRISLEIPQGRMMRNNRFQEPPFEVLQRHLNNLARVMRCH